mmetsp:Transcript_116683/g.362542  ORF Transcript_116683/g.362542 Transcript_116683/m.362542 type:complete len:80 (+) Transcript_116683:167-406(+)
MFMVPHGLLGPFSVLVLCAHDLHGSLLEPTPLPVPASTGARPAQTAAFPCTVTRQSLVQWGDGAVPSGFEQQVARGFRQ